VNPQVTNPRNVSDRNVGPNARARVLYISYDGMSEPLGRSQVLAYLLRLAGVFQVTLISFEKGRIPNDLRSEIETAGITWVPLRYHRWPPVVSTLLDVLAGRRAIQRLVGSHDIAHVRSYVPALIALAAGRERWGRLLFDIRGFWADERVEGGLWPSDGWLYRLAKRCERWFFSEADAVVTLTAASVPQVRSWAGKDSIPVEVIPTCVDLCRFTARPVRPSGQHAIWIGSVGTWYRFDLVPPLVRALGLPLTVVTPQTDLARAMLGTLPAAIVSRRPEEVVEELFAGDVGLCLIKSSFSKVASAPTRFAEYLAVGVPVVVTPGVGDLEDLVEREEIGVVLRDETPDGLAAAAASILSLASDPAVRAHCREVARTLFDADVGSRRYGELYGRLLESQSCRGPTG
jgi:glycosyltransferase involved in cell wall biosynthesis